MRDAETGTRNRRTALITGASSGLGHEFAKLFARDGYDLLLVARREERLREIAATLHREHGVRTEVLGADLSDPQSLDVIARALADRGIAVDALVNNAGFPIFGPFTETDADREREMIEVNVVALTRLAKLVLPGMVHRGSGRILNVASTAAFQPGPLMAVYYATKAYVLSFSQAIGNEVRGTGVTVTALCPGPVATEFQAVAGIDVSRLRRLGLVMDAVTVARAGYRALQRGKPLAIPGLHNWLGTQAQRFAPRRLVTRVVRAMQDRLVDPSDHLS